MVCRCRDLDGRAFRGAAFFFLGLVSSRSSFSRPMIAISHANVPGVARIGAGLLFEGIGHRFPFEDIEFAFNRAAGHVASQDEIGFGQPVESQDHVEVGAELQKCSLRFFVHARNMY